MLGCFSTLFDSRTNRRLPAALIFLVCAGAYFLTRSPALDEWDSVQFAFGVGDFNLWRHQPHPPGYPLYVAAGWLVASRLLPLDVPDALQLVSALGGGLFVACWFVLIARRFGPIHGVLLHRRAGDAARHLDDGHQGAHRSGRRGLCSLSRSSSPTPASGVKMSMLHADAHPCRPLDGRDGRRRGRADGRRASAEHRCRSCSIVVLTILAVRRPFRRRCWDDRSEPVFGGASLALVVANDVLSQTTHSRGISWRLAGLSLSNSSRSGAGGWTSPRHLSARWVQRCKRIHLALPCGPSHSRPADARVRVSVGFGLGLAGGVRSSRTGWTSCSRSASGCHGYRSSAPGE